MNRLSLRLLTLCSVWIMMMTFYPGAAAAVWSGSGTENAPALIAGAVTVKSDLGYFKLQGHEIPLPDSGKVIYGSVDDLDGSEASLTDKAFTALTPGEDYTWWLYYDETDQDYCLCFQNLVMTEPYEEGSVVECLGGQNFFVRIKESTLLGNSEVHPIILSEAGLKLEINHATLIQSNGGDIADGSAGITAAVKDGTLRALDADQKYGGSIFVVKDNGGELTATFSGKNQIAAFCGLLKNFSLDQAAGTTLNVQTDLSFISHNGSAIYSDNDVAVLAAPNAILALDAGEDQTASAIDAGGGVTVVGGTLNLKGMASAIHSGGSADFKDCTLTATGGDGFGALSAAGDIQLGEGLSLISPKNGVVKRVTRTEYKSDDGITAYVKLAAGNTTVYYDCLHHQLMAEADFQTAVGDGSIQEQSPSQSYTVTTGVLGSPTVQIGPTYTAAGYFVKNNDDYKDLIVSVDVVYNAKESEAKAALPAAAYLKLESSTGHTVYVPVTLTWTLINYNGNAAGIYAAAAKVTYTNVGVSYPGVTSLDNVAGKISITAPPHKCVNYSDHDSWAAWAKPYICFVIENTLMNSNAAGSLYFDAENTLTRGMVVQILYNVSGRPPVTVADIGEYDSRFSDVKAGQWYYNAVVWAANNNIAAGVGNQCFDPNAAVTREQVVTFLWRFDGYPSANGVLTDFGDSAGVSDFAKDGFSWSVEKRIINGISTSSGVALSPKTNCTRAQMAIIMTKYARTCMTDSTWINISDL